MKTAQASDLVHVERGEQTSGADSIYLYCFARASMARHIHCEGIDGRGRVAAIASGDVAAIFSAVSLEEFTDAASDKPRDLDWVIPRACRHDEVVKQVMPKSPVLPVRFGSVFSSREELKNLLAEKAGEISRFLDRVEGKEEWVVQAFMNLAKTRSRLLSLDPDLLLQQQAMSGSPGSRYLCEKRLQAEGDRRLRDYRRLIAGAVREDLAHYAEESRVLRLRSGPSETSPAGEGSDEMILHCAFLVARGSIADFLARVKVPQIAGADEIQLRPTGPWPPYDFCPSILVPDPGPAAGTGPDRGKNGDSS